MAPWVDAHTPTDLALSKSALSSVYPFISLSFHQSALSSFCPFITMPFRKSALSLQAANVPRYSTYKKQGRSKLINLLLCVCDPLTALAISSHLGVPLGGHRTSKMLCLYPLVLTFGESAVSGFLFTSISSRHSHAYDILSFTGPEDGPRLYISKLDSSPLPTLYHFALVIQFLHCKWFHTYSN